MSVIFKVVGNDHPKKKKVLSKCPICKISTKNIIAYSIYQESDSNSYHVFVRDFVTPWQNFKVCTSENAITVLDWSFSAEFLLVGYKGGNVEIWSPENHLLNSWILCYKAYFPGEDIINSKFFFNGFNVKFNSQKKDLSSYSDKFERMDYRHTLTFFGMAAIDGCIIITASGLLGVFLIPKLGNQSQCITLNAITQSIGLSRNYIASSSLSHCQSGSINIAVSCGKEERIINCFKVRLKMENDNKIRIKCESYSNVFLDPGKKRVSHLRWVVLNNADIIFIVYECAEGSVVEQWILTRKHHVVHNLLQKSKEDFMQSHFWKNDATIFFTAEIAAFCFSKLISDRCHIFAVLKDSTVHVLEPGLKKVCVTELDGPKDSLQTCTPYFAADVTSLNTILFILDDNAQMYAMQVPTQHFEKSMKASFISMQVSLLEYCIVTGMDACDILMLNISNLDIIMERLTDNFTRQQAITKQFYYSSFLSLKSNIYRIQPKQQNFDDLLVLHSISITFKSLLRPSDLSCHEKGPADDLSIILSDPIPDVDKILFNLDAKDFTVEPLTLQSLQQLIQWVADLALNVLNKLPEELIREQLNKDQAYEISRDIVAIGSMRELLVMIRIWGLLNPQCLPTYTKSMENVDVLSILFRLLTRLYQNIAEPDELLLDECSNLPTHVLIPPKRSYCSTTLFNFYNSTTNSFPQLFTASIDPVEFLEMQVDEGISPVNLKGVTTLLFGAKTTSVRKCVRCGFVNKLHKIPKTSALKAWCYRWMYCHCGGYWTTK